MVRYFESVFTVIYATHSTVQESMGMTAHDLAVVTAQECFEEADTNRDGKLSFREFQAW